MGFLCHERGNESVERCSSAIFVNIGKGREKSHETGLVRGTGLKTSVYGLKDPAGG